MSRAKAGARRAHLMTGVSESVIPAIIWRESIRRALDARLKIAGMTERGSVDRDAGGTPEAT
jgi:hypothetical protein